MRNMMSLRFESLFGGVSLFLNGFLLFGPEDVGRAGSQIALFLRQGPNKFELIAERAGVQASFTIIDMSEGDGDPDLAPILMEGRLSEGAMRAEEYLTIETELPFFAWLEAGPIDDIDRHRQLLFELAKSLATTLERGPDERLLDLLGLKHSEIAMSADITKHEMDEGLLGGLAELRNFSSFRVDLAEYEDFLPVLGSNSLIVSLRRRSGGDAIRIVDGIGDPGFSVSVAFIGERWEIVR